MNNRTLPGTLPALAVVRRALAVSISAAFLTACAGGEGEGEEDGVQSLEEIEGIRVSLSDYRYGVQTVGSRTQQRFQILNVGVDTYPINNITISGDNPDDFVSEIPQGVVLEPGDKLDLDVVFSPLGSGQRTASLDIDYDTIIGVGSNRVEALYYNAREFEEAGDYVTAISQYRDYLNAGSTTGNRARAIIKLPLLQEADIYGTGADFGLYKGALDKRDDGESDAAIQLLDAVIRQHDGSYLVDDAKYMRAYIQMADFGDYQTASDGFQKLIDEHPDSSYVDTALYSQGLAQHELGNLARAEEIFLALKDRHTGIKLDLFEVQWPKDNYVSRLWFDRSEQQLEEIQQQTEEPETPAAAPETPAAAPPSDDPSDGATICEDPDGDGWGWDGTKSCKIEE